MQGCKPNAPRVPKRWNQHAHLRRNRRGGGCLGRQSLLQRRSSPLPSRGCQASNFAITRISTSAATPPYRSFQRASLRERHQSVVHDAVFPLRRHRQFRGRSDRLAELDRAIPEPDDSTARRQASRRMGRRPASNPRSCRHSKGIPCFFKVRPRMETSGPRRQRNQGFSAVSTSCSIPLGTKETPWCAR